MVDTSPRVMGATDGPADRRTTRSRAPRRPGVVRDSVADTAAVTGIAGGGAPAVAAQAALVTQAAVAESPREVTFAAAVAAFTAGREALRRRDLLFEDVPAPKRLEALSPAARGAPR